MTPARSGALKLPIVPPYPPMELASVERIPDGPHWQYEPKWDGFRCLAFRDGDRIELQSKSGRPLSRYFPELTERLGRLRAQRFVIDGELAIPSGAGFSFDDLLQRIHPAASRIQKLSKETPALMLVFDLLVDDDGGSLTAKPLRERRRALERFAARFFKGARDVRLSPATMDRSLVEAWLRLAGPAADGVVAKDARLEYRSGDRSGGQKIKLLRTADCVVGGFRYASKAKVIGSLLLGLYDTDGKLHHVGFSSGFSAEERKALVGKLKPLISPPGFTGRAPGGPSRWSTKRSEEWEPLRPKLVVEVSYDHVTGERFRHGTRVLRWRPDKPPRDCTMDQIGSRGGGLEAILPTN